MLKTVDTILIIVTTSTFITLVFTGFGLTVLLIVPPNSTGVPCGFSSGKKIHVR